MAILTSSDIDYGVIFGPVNVESPAMNPTRLIGLMTEDTRCEKDDRCLSVSTCLCSFVQFIHFNCRIQVVI